MLRALSTIVLQALVAIGSSAFADAKASGEGPFVVRLSPNQQMVPHGTAPRFTVTIEARSSMRILKLDARKDLRENFAVLFVTKEGRAVEVPVMISDPGPIDANAYVGLDRGETMTFAHDGEPKVLAALPVGKYVARIGVQNDWRAWPIESNEVTFEVR